MPGEIKGEQPDRMLTPPLFSDPSFTPAYLYLRRSSELAARANEALDRLAACDLCPRYCRVDRRDSIKGALCHTGTQAVVRSYGAYHGEENPLRGIRGSGIYRWSTTPAATIAQRPCVFSTVSWTSTCRT